MVSGAIQEEEHQLSSGWWFAVPGSTRELLSSRIYSPIHIETQWWSIAPLRFGSSCDRYLYYTTCFLAILIQPLRGWRYVAPWPQVATWGYSVLNPFGVGFSVRELVVLW